MQAEMAATPTKPAGRDDQAADATKARQGVSRLAVLLIASALLLLAVDGWWLRRRLRAIDAVAGH